MKSTRLLPVIVLIAAVLLSACSGLSLSLAAPVPAARSNSRIPSTGANAPQAGNPVVANPQSVADVAALQGAFESIYQNVNPSVVTIEISSRTSAINGSGGSGSGGRGNGQNGQGQIVPTAEGSGFIWDSAGD